MPDFITALHSRYSWYSEGSMDEGFLVHVILTEKCNLSCVYCYLGYEKRTRLAYEPVKKKLFETLDMYDGIKVFQVQFFGGEPLLEFETICTLTDEVEQFWKQKGWNQADLRFGTTTNGTLLNDTMKRWFNEHPNFDVDLSLDGTPEAHNRNRNNSYDKIEPHFDFFRKYNRAVKMTISPYTLDQCALGIKHLHSLGFEIHANIIFEDVWGDEVQKAAHLQIFARELSTLIVFYKQNPHLKRTTLLPPLYRPLPQKKQMEHLEELMCGMGLNMVAIGTDAQMYPCDRVIPLCREEGIEAIEITRPSIEPASCAACQLLPVCPECRAFNYEVHGDTNHKTTFHCEFVKIQQRASAIMAIHDIEEVYAQMDKEALSEKEKDFLSWQIDSATFIESYTRGLAFG